MRAALALLVLTAALAAPTAAPARESWYARADRHCAVATGEGKRLVAAVIRVRTEQDVVAWLRRGVAIQTRLLGRLRAARPPARARRFVSLLARSEALDRRSVARIAEGVKRDAIQAWIDEGSRLEQAAHREAARIGLRRCAAYLDPATYK
jgi:hypothetical protein